MTVKRRFTNWLEKRNKRMREEEVSVSDLWHSHGYHKFFEGYSEYYVQKPNGKQKIERIYTGLYYQANLSPGKLRLLRLAYGLLYICLVYLFISAGISMVSSNFAIYTSIPQALYVPILFYLGISVGTYIFQNPKMQIYRYRTSSQAIIKASIVGSVYCDVIFVANLVYMLVNLTFTSEVVLNALKFLLCAAIQAVLYIAEKHVEYNKILNDIKVPDYGTEIV